MAVGGFTLYSAFASSTFLVSLQAEQMTLPQSATIITDALASGGQGVKMIKPGSLTGTVNLPSASDSFNVVARATRCRNAWPKMTVAVDAKTLISTNVTATTWTTYNLTTALASGDHKVTITYAGRAKSGGCVPVLFVDVANFNGATAPPPPAPTVTINASPSSISSGTAATLTWSSTNATGCSASGAWSGAQPASGSVSTGALSQTSTFSLACTGSGGSASASTTVTVTATPPPPPGGGAVWLPTSARPYTLQWMLDGALDTTNAVQMGLKDLNGNTLPAPDVYDIDGELNSAATVDALHAMGKKVICYIDAGVWEDYRSDATKFPGVQNEGKTYNGDPQYAGIDIIGSQDNGWAGSKWMDVRRIDILQPIMTARMLNWCKNKHFDAIEPDEITDWSNNPGFPISYNDQIAYNRAVASWAHNLGMSIGLKGDLEQAHDLVTNFDWTLNEECFLYSECTTINNSGGPGADGKDYPGLQLFAQANKAVWVAEYPSEYPANQRSGKALTASAQNTICTTSQQQHFNTAFYILGLPQTGGRTPCPTASATTW